MKNVIVFLENAYICLFAIENGVCYRVCYWVCYWFATGLLLVCYWGDLWLS